MKPCHVSILKGQACSKVTGILPTSQASVISAVQKNEVRILIAEICEQLRENRAILDMAPNFISALKTYIVLPSSTCEAERSFSTLQDKNLFTLDNTVKTFKRFNRFNHTSR